MRYYCAQMLTGGTIHQGRSQESPTLQTWKWRHFLILIILNVKCWIVQVCTQVQVALLLQHIHAYTQLCIYICIHVCVQLVWTPTPLSFFKEGCLQNTVVRGQHLDVFPSRSTLSSQSSCAQVMSAAYLWLSKARM